MAIGTQQQQSEYKDAMERGFLIACINSVETEEGDKWFPYAVPDKTITHAAEIIWINHRTRTVVPFNGTPLGSLFHLTIGD